ncbi:MAG: outer membrane beta-barrel protein [Terriglobales bacterium]
MSPKRLAALLVFVVILISAACAQQNEVSATLGRTFVSSQRIQGANFSNPNIHFGNGITVGGNYSRLLKTYGLFGISGEVPFAYGFDMDLNTGENLIPEGYKSFFVTPAVRVNFFPDQGVSPWVSAGGGYGYFKQSSQLVFGGPNPGKTSTNTGVFEFGAGLDVWPWHNWGLRLEARDYYSGVPDLNVTTVRSRQHNYYVGGGFIRRF